MTDNEVSVFVLARDRASRKLRKVVDDAEGFRISGAFSRMEKAVPAILDEAPRVVLLELDLPGAVDFEAVMASLRREREGLEIVVVCDQDDERLVPALRAGAVGHLTRRSSSGEVVDALAAVARGEAALSAAVTRRLIDDLHARAPVPTPPPYTYDLTSRERQILAAMIEGESDAAVAERLQISHHTVRAHIKSLYRKLGVSSRAAAVAKALREELL